MPRFLTLFSLINLSQKFTLAFSNTPGPIKPFLYCDEKGSRVRTIQSSTYMIVSGKVGLNVACMTFCDSFKVTCTSDDQVFSEDETNRLVKLIHEAVSN